jgi:hypothetical protein
MNKMEFEGGKMEAVLNAVGLVLKGLQSILKFGMNKI